MDNNFAIFTLFFLTFFLSHQQHYRLYGWLKILKWKQTSKSMQMESQQCGKQKLYQQINMDKD